MQNENNNDNNVIRDCDVIGMLLFSRHWLRGGCVGAEGSAVMDGDWPGEVTKLQLENNYTTTPQPMPALIQPFHNHLQ
jgi:hypothetical protein